ncbi:serine/threonine-protein kinase 17A-like isoform X2 [Zootermopsis nevadensis]|uniref:serine/threonine-protein kinase 17A-like isoform X2 n=1 Tax=Zootermopsis nevadensis TaxID=136037 RepID=UPI000B8E7D6A|nr:serine/threonine-protein kinase 17A-like isoform X2 [Zootermopsis nevadensis]
MKLRGKFAAVRKCTHKETGVEYAAKFIRKRRRATDQRKGILHEVAVLKIAADSARIVRLHEVYETSTEMALILELAAGGELQRVLDAEEGLEEQHVARVMRQILEGLCYLHDNNIAHLDLKPQNLLLTGAYPDCDIKLCDFGISRVIKSGVEVREILGTPDYVAPEVLGYEPISLATDIWSVGVLTYVLLSGYSPFAGNTKQETFCNISQCCLSFPDELFDGVSSVAKDFIQATLVKDPSKRLTSHQCLEHPWLSEPCIVEKLSSSCQADTELTISSSSPASSRLDHSESTDIKSLLVNRAVQCHNFETNRINGKSCSSSFSNGGIFEENGVHNSDTKATSPSFGLQNNGTNIVDGNHETDSEEHEELPVQKRPKNSEDRRSTTYPVASCLLCAQCGMQCCRLHRTSATPELLHMTRQHRHSSMSNSPVEVILDRGITC